MFKKPRLQPSFSETVVIPGENTSAQTGNSSLSELSPPELSVKLPELSDLPTISNPWETVELPVDILLLTVEDCEFLGCFALQYWLCVLWVHG